MENIEKNRPTICLALICKDEESCIENALESVYRNIDYWVICDTGSTDRTKEIIKNFFDEKGIPGELHEDEWIAFDKNKTLMMQRAFNKADYIIHMDADDIYVGDLNFTYEDSGFDCYQGLIRRQSASFKALILFSGKLNWRFCGVAHTIIKTIEKGSNYSRGDLSNKNFYMISSGSGARSSDPEKYLKDAEKLKKQFFETLLDDPDGLNNRSAFYTAQSYMDQGMFEDATKWYRLYLRLKDTWIEECFESHLRIARIYTWSGKDQGEIVSEFLKAIDIFPDRAEPYFFLGVYYNSMGDFENGYKYLKSAKELSIENANNKYMLFINVYTYGKYVNDELSVSCYWVGKYQESIDLIQEIINDDEFIESRERLNSNLEFSILKIQEKSSENK
jgi:glycosyltransferase involved in cell wall biosynthesis